MNFLDFYIQSIILALDPLTKGVEGVGKLVPKAKPEVKKPKVVSRRNFYFDERKRFI